MQKAVRSPRTLATGLLAAALLTLPAPAQAGKFDDVIEEFEDNGPYVEPFATLFGSMSNAGWYQSAGVSGRFGFYLGLPMSITNISDNDRTYDATFTDEGCVLFHADADNPQRASSACPEKVEYKAPTIFGRARAQTNKLTVYDPNANQIVDTIEVPVSDGLPDVADFNWFPFGIPQVGVNLFHTELKLRYLAIPLDEYSFSMFGIGLQHDLGSFLPPLPVSVSLAGNYTKMSAEITPDDDNIDGTLELDGDSYFMGVLVGYNLLGMFEVFAELGWEKASLHSGGSLVVRDPTGGEPPENVEPDLTVDGRNGFRAALNLAFHFGYQAVAGQNLGANMGNQLSLLGFRLKL